MIRILQIEVDDVRAADATDLQRVLQEVASNPTQARALQGSIVLGFEPFEVEGVPLTADPVVMAYVRAAHAAVPHLFYFLAPEEELGAVLFFIVANASPGEIQVIDGNPHVAPSDELVRLLTRHLVETARFAQAMADDAEGILLRLAHGSGQADMLKVAAYALAEVDASIS